MSDILFYNGEKYVPQSALREVYDYMAEVEGAHMGCCAVRSYESLPRTDEERKAIGEHARALLETDHPVLTDRTVDIVADVCRDWIHETPISECGPGADGADTCPDWGMAYDLARKIVSALKTREALRPREES